MTPDLAQQTAPPGIEGVCHLCQTTQQVRHCVKCDHWFCEACRRRWASRGLAAVKQMIGGREPGCCGPPLASIR
jgi:hypothetical protein